MNTGSGPALAPVLCRVGLCAQEDPTGPGSRIVSFLLWLHLEVDADNVLLLCLFLPVGCFLGGGGGVEAADTTHRCRSAWKQWWDWEEVVFICDYDMLIKFTNIIHVF